MGAGRVPFRVPFHPLARPLTAAGVGGGFVPIVSDGVLAPFVTFTRNSAATRTNAAGQVELVAANVPRIDYDPVTGELRGLLIEEQRTNLLLRSQEFDNASWSKYQTTVTANAATAPDGTATANKLVDTVVNDVHQCSQAPVLAENTNYTLSVYAKAAERSILRLAPTTKAGVTQITNFNLSSGTVGTIGTGHTASINPVGNGWYRCAITFNSGSGGSSNIIRIATAVVDGSSGYTGDGVSGLLVWGAQLEAGAFATSYIPTTDTAQTRAIDDPDFTIPAGIVRLEYTYDDDTTADVAVTPGAAYQIPTGQKRIKHLRGYRS